LRLWNFWRSSASFRVRIGLHWKRLPFQYLPVRLAKEDGEQQGTAYRATNPMQQVPCLEWEEDGNVRRLGQSVAILEYLEERYPERPLLPKDGWGRARVRELVETVNSGIQPLQNLPVMREVERLGGEGPAFARIFIRHGLLALEDLARPAAGEFLWGGAPTLADAFLVPQLSAARRLGVDLDGLPTLLRAEANALALPEFLAAEPERQIDAPAP
jgi:maleylpyruvate isomerase